MNLIKHWAAVLDDYVIDLAWAPDGVRLAAASASGPVTLFATPDGAKRHELAGHAAGTNVIAWAPDGDASDPILATGGQDGAVRLWNCQSGKPISKTLFPQGWVEHLAWSPAPRTATVLAAAAGRVLALVGTDGSERHRFPPAPKTISALAWRPRRTFAPHPPGPPAPSSVLAVAYFGGVCLWNPADFSAWKEFSYGSGIHALAWSPDGRWLVSGNQDPSVHLWIPDGDVELHMSGYESKVKHLSFDHTSHWLATGGGRDASVWDCTGDGPEGREPLMFPHDAPVCAVAYQNGHGLLASASEDGVVMLWSPDRKQPLRATVRMPARPTRLAWSPDDSFLAIGTEAGTVYVLNAEA